MDKKYSIVLIVILSLSLSSVSAIGLTPARSTVDFSPSLQKEMSFTIVNSEKKDLNVVVAVQGELKDYVAIDTPNFFMSSQQETRQVNYRLSLPEELKPGARTAEIVVLQLPEQGSLSVTYVGAALAVINELVVNVPYPGKFIESELGIYGPDADGNFNFVLPLWNRGSFEIAEGGATIDIRCPEEGKVIATLGTERVSIGANQRKDVSSQWTPKVQAGNCKALATITYDNEPSLNVEKIFEVGGNVLTLVNIEAADGFELGGIAEIQAVVRNNVQQSVEGVYLELDILDESGNVLANVKSPTQNVQPQEKTELPLYLNTKGFAEGTYDARLKMIYGEGEESVNFQALIQESEMSFVGVGYVIAKPSKKNSDGLSSMMIVLIILIAFLILINLSWFLFLRKRLK